MNSWKNKVAIVTGAGEGIGAEIAKDLAKIGMIVIGFEATEDKVSQMFDNQESWENLNGQLIPYKCDISQDDDLKRAFEGIVAEYHGVDLMINNAAIGKEGLIATGDLYDLKKIVDVNIYGTIACTHYAIQSMVKKKSYGYIININSICGHYMPKFAEPKINMYIASKRAMSVLNTYLRKEIKSLACNIKVTSISPGLVKTNIFKSAGVTFLNDDFFQQNPYLTTRDVSNIVIKILSAPRGIQVNEVIFHALHEVY